MKTDLALLAPSRLGLGREAPAFRADDHARRLARIEAALARMESGRYGFCIACEGRIPLARLEADPTATACGTCDTCADG